MRQKRGHSGFVFGEVGARTAGGYVGQPPWSAVGSGSGVLHEDEGALHVHGGGDELKMAGVASEAPIAHAAHAIPTLQRGVGPLDATTDARRPGVHQFLPGFEGLITPSLPGDAIDQTAGFEPLPESLAVIGLVGEIALLVALDQRVRQTGVVDIGGVISA